MHPSGADAPKSMHSHLKYCAHKHEYVENIWKNGASAGFTAFEIMHSAAKTCTPGSGYTLNFDHCICMKTFLIDQTQRQHSSHNIPLSHRTGHSQ